MPCTRSARAITTEAATVSDPGGATHREAAASIEAVDVASTAATATTTAAVMRTTISEASVAPTMAIIGATKEEVAVDTEIKTTITITMLATVAIIGGTETLIKTAITIGSSPESTMAMKTTTITTMPTM